MRLKISDRNRQLKRRMKDNRFAYGNANSKKIALSISIVVFTGFAFQILKGAINSSPLESYFSYLFNWMNYVSLNEISLYTILFVMFCYSWFRFYDDTDNKNVDYTMDNWKDEVRKNQGFKFRRRNNRNTG